MLYPQYTKNLRVKDKALALSDEEVLKETAEVEKLIGGNGRVLLRQSGTEPVVRVMIESESMNKCIEYADRIINKAIERGHKSE